ncbi:hypothetical protein CgunFtcFv8_023042 [Champsocephalus gunnari]|uniref:ZP domain-containing protein n=1 Tax=Champsocephalus gunnari TaxID=52237 RepID=A0AAN8DCG8_CHAGU|nr:hypothetical protein CgunFtcFv8_023042 [Champsocephalus gunnari]
MLRLGNILLWMAAANILGQARPNLKLYLQSSSGLRSDCAANVMRLSLDKALAVGNQLEVEAINGTKHILLTPSMAAQCGYSMESDPWGNTRIYTSLMGCFVDNKDDATFNVGLRLQMYGENPSDVVSHDVSQTCSYTRWASREILCDRNYMEVSHHMANLDAEAKGQTRDGKDEKLNANLEASGASQGIWKMTFYTPEPVAMVLQEAEQAGYAAKTTSSRLVMRSPYNTAETYSEDVAGVPMEVFRVSAYFMAPQGLHVVNLAAACPKGGVLFTEDMISWHDDTVPETRVFNVLLGTFLHDVELRNITFSTGVLTVEESNAKGFTVQEHSLANGSKSFSLQVPFDADVVLKHNPERLVTSYFLPLIFGLIVLPEETPFALPVDLQASLQDVVLPIMAGTCDQNQFYISVKFGTTECHPNGTMTAVAVKVESTRNLKPSQLTLKDQSCTPQFSDDRVAYFSFSVDTCGTTRTFFDNYMMYENEIRLSYNNAKGAAKTSPVDPDYRQTISCFYVVNETQTVAFSAKPRTYEPAAEISTGQLMVQMRLSQDPSYELFYQAEDYPVVKYLQQPLYFEVELMHSTDPHLELIAENCWATLYEDGTSLPSWDIIVDR